jgi:hypothetical protein
MFDKAAFRSFLTPKKEELKEIVKPKEIEKVVEETITFPELEEPKIEKKEIVEEIVEEIKEEPKEKTLNEKEEFEMLELSKNDLLELKKIAFSDILQEDITISELVDLVLLSKSGKSVKAKNKDSLVIREYVDINGKITTKGKVYLEEETTKNRLKEILS